MCQTSVTTFWRHPLPLLGLRAWT